MGSTLAARRAGAAADETRGSERRGNADHGTAVIAARDQEQHADDAEQHQERALEPLAKRLDATRHRHRVASRSVLFRVDPLHIGKHARDVTLMQPLPETLRVSHRTIA